MIFKVLPESFVKIWEHPSDKEMLKPTDWKISGRMDAVQQRMITGVANDLKQPPRKLLFTK